MKPNQSYIYHTHLKKFLEHRINPSLHNTRVPMSLTMADNGQNYPTRFTLTETLDNF